MLQNSEIFHFKRKKCFFGNASIQSTAFETSFTLPLVPNQQTLDFHVCSVIDILTQELTHVLFEVVHSHATTITIEGEGQNMLCLAALTGKLQCNQPAFLHTLHSSIFANYWYYSLHGKKMKNSCHVISTWPINKMEIALIRYLSEISASLLTTYSQYFKGQQGTCAHTLCCLSFALRFNWILLQARTS